jgi:peptide/nickel transport system ATP-binding protein
MTEPLVSIKDLNVRFTRDGQSIQAVNGVSFEQAPGEVLGVLGESGSGKSVTLRAMLRILPEHRSSVTGAIRVDGRDVLALSGSELEDYRGGTVSMIFQEPMLAFDPVFTIGQQIAESVRRHMRVDEAAARARALEMLERMQIPSARRRLDAYPHEMSGGMRQRAMIALALACKPKLLLADEPTTALDATVQIQILLLLRELQRELGMSVIFVTHDVGVAIEVADRLAVMYAGRIVETGSVSQVIRSPQHPYTQGLLSSTVRGELRGQRIEAIPGSPPDLAALPPGCAFAPRCRRAVDACMHEAPASFALGAGHEARCVLLRQAA